MGRQVNQAGLDLVKRFEGLKLRAYRCPAGVWTVGYGSTKGVTQGMVITQAEAEERLREDLQDAERTVSHHVKVPINDNEFSALVSMVFNIGPGAFAASTLLRLLNGNQRKAAAGEFRRWVRGGGRVLPGLVSRRAAERVLFLTPIEPEVNVA